MYFSLELENPKYSFLTPCYLKIKLFFFEIRNDEEYENFEKNYEK